MKKLFFTFLLILALSASLIAQPMRNGRENRQEKPLPKENQENNRKMEKDRKKIEDEMSLRRLQMIKEAVKMLAKKYGLSQEQTEKLEKLFSDLMKTQNKLMDELKKEMEALRQKHEKELKELLGDKYDEFKKEMDKLHKPIAPGRDTNRPARLTPEKVAELLKLSETQTKTYIELFDKTLKKFQNIRKNNAGQNIDRTKVLEQMKKIIEEFETELKKLFTKDQWQKYTKLKNDIFPMMGQSRRTERSFRFQIPNLKDLISELKLSETQTENVKKLLTQLSKDQQKLMKSMSNRENNGNEIMDKFKVMFDKFEADLKKILTEDQFKKYQELKKKSSQRPGNRGQNRGGMFGLERLIQSLELTEEQEKSIKQFYKEFTEAANKLRENQGNPEKMREKMQALVQELMKKVESQLTEEQKKKFKELTDKLHENRRSDRPEQPEDPNRPNRPERPGNHDKPERPNRPENPVLPR